MYTGADTGLSVGCISADKVRGKGEAFSAGLPDQRPAGKRAGYQGKNNTHTTPCGRLRRARQREEEIVREGEGGGGQESCGREVWGVTEEEEGRELDHAIQSIFFTFTSFVHVTCRERQHITVITPRQTITLSHPSQSTASR